MTEFQSFRKVNGTLHSKEPFAPKKLSPLQVASVLLSALGACFLFFGASAAFNLILFYLNPYCPTLLCFY